jgi:hypothetical protein
MLGDPWHRNGSRVLIRLKVRVEAFPNGPSGFIGVAFRNINVNPSHPGGRENMKKIVILLVGLIFLFIGCEKKSLPPQEKQGNPPPKVIVEKERVEKEHSLPPEVKIKLKKDGKDSYSWELSGSDVDQILKVNEKLRKQLGGEPSR